MQGREKHRLVIVGGGVAGIEIATALGRRDGAPPLDIALVDADVAHVWKPILHTIAAGTRDVAQQEVAYVVQARDAGFRYVPGPLVGLDRVARAITVGAVTAADGRLVVPERRLPYDTLVLAVGSQANDFGTPGVAAHCWMIDSRRQAMAFNREIRIRMLQSLALEQDLPIVIVGGGATGVELAAELVQLVDISAGLGASGLRGRMRVTLLESGPRLLAGFPEDISAATLARLRGLGISVRLGAQVTEATERGFTLADGDPVPAALMVWAAGVRAPPLLSNLDGLAVGRQGQLLIRPSLQTTEDPAIYAVGDCASLTPAGAERPLPATAQVASQQAAHLVRHLPGAITGRQPVPDFVFHDRGMLVALADYDAYGSLGRFGLFRGMTFRGRLAQLSHEMLYRSHQAMLFGFWRGSLAWLADRLNARVRRPAGPR
ncbi:NAD(P)/FAD-dependent oxidoreductase [Acidisoma sp. 7E03]